MNTKNPEHPRLGYVFVVFVLFEAFVVPGVGGRPRDGEWRHDRR